MTVELYGIGATADGTTSLSVAYPASIAAGEMLLLFIGSKFNTSSHSPPGDWNLLDTDVAGAGADSGSDTGTAVASVYWKIAAGTETGNITVSVTSGNVAQAFICRYNRTAGSGWDLASTTARWTTDNTNPISVTFDDDPGITVDDVVAVFTALNANLSTNIASTTLAATGVTVFSPLLRRFTSTSTGGDMLVCLWDYEITLGSSSAAPTWQATKSTNPQGEGPVLLVRLREASGGGGFQAAWARNSNTMIGAAQ
jgi:MSHA biogenesis protein MshQ